MNCTVSGRTLVVVGNGMVGARFCERLVDYGVVTRYRTTVFGEERRPAYDRVHLSSYVEHRDAARLELLPAAWYPAHGIDLHLDERIVAVDRAARVLTSSKGRTVRYDVLVFATGSAPFVPPIAGTDRPGVFVYRTLDDLDAILGAAQGRHRAVVIGGGLLGLEAAQAMTHLGLETHVVERAPFLMPQQLNEDAARVLENEVRRRGVQVHLRKQTTGISSGDPGLRLRFQDGDELTADIVIVSAGIRPRTELARDAGFVCDASGGLVVDDGLHVDEAVFAIGECASHRRRVYGLAAPGYAMADVLAARLAGRTAEFRGAALSTRLKALGVDVLTSGDCAPDREQAISRSATHHRALFFDGAVLVGAVGVGEWPEAAMVQAAVNRGDTLSRDQRRRFERTGRLWDAAASAVCTWSDDTLVCNCLRIAKGTLRRAIADGAAGLDDLVRKTGASTLCGACRPLVAELAGAPAPVLPAAAWRGLFAISLLALGLAIVTACVSPPPMADSVQSLWWRVDALWREPLYKQASGFSLLGLSATALLLSLRKRMRRFSWGHFASWRTFHSALGASTLVMLFAHTGFRLGTNLNFWLMAVFLAMNLLGAITGLSAALETRGTGGLGGPARRYRPLLAALHLYLSWPLPILLLFHVLSVYLY
jgi:nitrite reductase (NADH) large subunit